MKSIKDPKTMAVLLAFLGLSFLFVPHTAKGAGQAQKNEADDPVFQAEGLHYEDILINIFRGDFLNIPFDRDEQDFVILFNTYVTSYASHCTASLPADSIELTMQECNRWNVYTNGYGVETRRECIGWETIGTGLYASPEMYNAKMVIEGLQAGDTFRNLWRMMTQEDPVGNAMSTVGSLQAAKTDMVSMFRMNGCEGPGLMRFQENLRRFALNKQPIRLGGDPHGKSNTGTLSKSQNFEKLVDDLVLEHSKKWVMNKYQRGSVSNVIISSSDRQDRPAEIKARYIYNGWGGQSEGSVRITFNDGLPECLYFFDFPYTCRTADRRIVAGYAEGSYQK